MITYNMHFMHTSQRPALSYEKFIANPLLYCNMWACALTLCRLWRGIMGSALKVISIARNSSTHSRVYHKGSQTVQPHGDACVEHTSCACSTHFSQLKVHTSHAKYRQHLNGSQTASRATRKVHKKQKNKKKWFCLWENEEAPKFTGVN